MYLFSSQQWCHIYTQARGYSLSSPVIIVMDALYMWQWTFSDSARPGPSNGAFALHGTARTARHGSARFGSVCFSTAVYFHLKVGGIID